ncbi:MAG: FAD-dependent oxidoreductase [Anaerolineae bacterium]|nr:FAD-dependent oxidoreductase [Anaerolineae bacterium]MDW8172987.1 FAD-dependent oxidoreductase [Anaerolineae bacterium]
MHRQTIILGGGLSGMVAALAVQAQGQLATLIEVKRRLGGAQHSLARDGFIFDDGSMAFAPWRDEVALELLRRLGLPPEQTLFDLETGGQAFRQGSAVLLEAIERQLSLPRLMRMAVSSVGEIEGGLLGVCLENGLTLSCERLILALPARQAGRVLAGYQDEAARLLLDYRYDSLQRLSLGYSQAPRLLSRDDLPEDMGYVAVHSTRQRCPKGGALLQVVLRLDVQRASGQALLERVCQELGLPLPDAWHAATWETADAITPYEPRFAERLARLRACLPPRLALVGSDYVLPPSRHLHLPLLDARLALAWSQAHRVAAI